MSRIGKLPVIIPSGVSVEVSGHTLKVNGTKGTLELEISKELAIEQQDGQLTLSRHSETQVAREQHGLMRTLLANTIKGVSEGFEKVLEINGVGFRAQVNGRKITLHLGYSHPHEYDLPEGIDARTDGNKLMISGIDKQLVGQVAAHIRELRKPEPYKGKGIKYEDEHIIRKAGKTAGAGAGK